MSTASSFRLLARLLRFSQCSPPSVEADGAAVPRSHRRAVGLAGAGVEPEHALGRIGARLPCISGEKPHGDRRRVQCSPGIHRLPVDFTSFSQADEDHVGSCGLEQDRPHRQTPLVRVA